MKPVMLLVDADSYVMAACSLTAEHDDEGNRINPLFSEDLEDSKLKFDNLIQNLVNTFEDMGVDCSYMLFLEGNGNVRKSLSTDYKISRKKRPQPPLRADIKNYALSNYVSYEAINVETDDVISATWHTYHKEIDLIICSPDKDLTQLPCSYYDTYWNREDDKRMFSISENQAQINFWRLVLMGDAGDDVKGVKGIGKKKAEAILPDSQSSSFAGGRVYRQYLNAYGLSRGAREFWRAYHLIKLPERGITIPDLTLFV